MTEFTKETIRASIQMHLDIANQFGLVDVMRSNVQIADLHPQSSQNIETAAQATPLDSLSQIQAELGNCTRCKLHSTRKSIVFGVGNPDANLMFVGEAPGADEDAQGLPFVGAAGQLLTKMIEAMGFKRDDVYIANIIKCRPPQNRNPESDEIETCSPFLKAQIESVRPKVIVALGKFAAQFLCETQIPITKLRGQFRDYKGIPVMPTFHPSFLLRSPEMKRPAWEDLQKVMQELEKQNQS